MFTTCISIFTYLYLRSFYKNKLIKFKSVGLRYDICIIFNGIIIVFRLTWIRFQRKTHCNRHSLFLIQYSWFIYSQKSMEAYNINNSIKQSSCFTFSRWWRYGQLKFTLTHFSGISLTTKASSHHCSSLCPKYFPNHCSNHLCSNLLQCRHGSNI